MAKYIQGSDVFISLRAKSLTGLTSTGEDDTLNVFFENLPMAGDVITVHLAVADQVLDFTYTVIDDDIGTLISDILAIINANPVFSAIEAIGHYGVVVASQDYAHIQITGTVTIAIAYNVIACTKSDVLNMENEFLEITQTEQKNTEYLPTFQSLSLSIEQAIVANVNTGQIDTTAMEDWAFNQSLLNFVFERPDSSANRKVSGQCYIKNFSESGGVNTGGVVSFEMIVTGAIVAS